jgi:hypothetical protein
MDDKLFQELEDFDVDQILSEIKKEVHNEIEVDKDTVSEEKTPSEKPAPEQKGADQQTEGKISFSFFTDPIPEQEEEVPPDTLEPYVEEAETEADSFDTNEPVASEKTNIFMELFLPVVGDSAGKLVRKGIVWICLAIILASTVWFLVAGGISGKTVAEPQSNVAVILTDAPSTNLKEGMELVR